MSTRFCDEYEMGKLKKQRGKPRICAKVDFPHYAVFQTFPPQFSENENRLPIESIAKGEKRLDQRCMDAYSPSLE